MTVDPGTTGVMDRFERAILEDVEAFVVEARLLASVEALSFCMSRSAIPF